jgi:hypothetical protein
MKKRSLLTTNQFLIKPGKRNRLLINTVLTSSAVEGIITSAKRALESEQLPSDTITPPDSAEKTASQPS